MLFAVASALVNCTNSYDYEEPDPKMVELAKYAKQHVPEQHPKVRGARRAGSFSTVGTRGIHSRRPFLRWFSSLHISLCCEKGAPFPVQSAEALSKLLPFPGQIKLCAGSGEEAAGGWGSISHDLHGEDREPGAD